MGRSHITPIHQPDDTTCGPSALKTAMEIFGKHKSLDTLIDLCKTNSSGTTTPNLIAAANKLGYSVLAVEYATLHHLQGRSNIRPTGQGQRSLPISMIWTKRTSPSGFRTLGSGIFIFRAQKPHRAFGQHHRQKKSYQWEAFRERWMDFDLKRKKIKKRGKKYKMIRRWQQQPLIILAKVPSDLPKFKISTAKYFPSNL